MSDNGNQSGKSFKCQYKQKEEESKCKHIYTEEMYDDDVCIISQGKEGLGLGLNYMKTYQWVKIILGRYCYRRSRCLNRDKHTINHVISYYYSIPW